MWQKDGQQFSNAQVFERHPSVSFGPNTFAELGYEPVVFSAPAPTREDAIARKWDGIKYHRDVLQQAGVQVGAYWFHNDLKSRSQWERMANKANTLGLADAAAYNVNGEQVQWKTMAGTFVPLTAGLIRQVVDAFEVQEAAIFKKAEWHRTVMSGTSDPATYDFSGGWPAIFAG